MGRAGIYKSEVVRARDKLQAMGRYPSIDAVRTELGNTGSKGTIHRYLKEIEEEEGAATGTKVAVSDAIADLVGRLAARLHEEADARIADAATQYTSEIQQLGDTLSATKEEAQAFRSQLERTQVTLAAEQASHGDTSARLQAETLVRTQLVQQVTDLQERLAAEERHRQSLEEKHQHAREALEHFRQSAKEQREQEQRQHDQQVQYLQSELRALKETLTAKQHEATQGHQENTRLANELTRAESDLHQAKTELRALRPLKDALVAAERHAEELGRHLVEEQARTAGFAELNAKLEPQLLELNQRSQDLAIELAAARSAIATQDQIVENIRQHFAEPKPKHMPRPAKGKSVESKEA
jgi:chromosome segregation ATPase